MATTDIAFDPLNLDSQLCFPLYVCSKEVVRLYMALLDDLDLTYTQYITMMALWEKHEVTVKELGDRLYLDSGTLTPLLKKLEAKGYVTRRRAVSDERKVIISLTDAGVQLRERAVGVPVAVHECVGFGSEDAEQLHALLHKLIETLQADQVSNADKTE